MRKGEKMPMKKNCAGPKCSRLGIRASFNYEKISNQRAGKKLVENYQDLLNFDLNIAGV